MRKPWDGSPRVEISNQKSKRMTWKQAWKQNDVLSILVPKNKINKSQNHCKINNNPVIYYFESILLVPLSSRVVPRCKNGLRGCARGAKMVSQKIKMEAPSPLKGNPRSQKGPAAKGVALKINRILLIRHRALRHCWSELMLKSCFCRNCYLV